VPDADVFRFSALSLPYVVLSAALIGVAITAVLVRANDTLKLASLAVVVTCLPYALGHALQLSCTDPALVALIARLYTGTVALIGPALMALALVEAGLHERYRALLVLGSVVACVLCVVTWSTDLVVDRVRLTPWGFLYQRGGPLTVPVLGMMLVAPMIAWILVRRSRLIGDSRSAQRKRDTRRYLVAIMFLTALGSTDMALIMGHGVYPWSGIAALCAIAASIISIVRYDVWQIRGFDPSGVVEIAAVVVVGGVATAVLWGLDAVAIRSGLAIAILLAPVLLAAQLVVTVARGRKLGARVDDEADLQLEEFVDATASVRDEQVLATGLGELLNVHGGLEKVRVLIMQGTGLRPPRGEGDPDPAAGDPASMMRLDARVRAWLVANHGLLVASELAPRRLGGLREPVEALFVSLHADVVVPLVDRDELVAVVSAEIGGRGTLTDEQRLLVTQAVRAAANGFTYLHLFREAEARQAVAREVEVASAVQQARATGEVRHRFGGCEVIACYRPAANFGGDWWTTHELPDGRVLVAIGDVSGRGVPVALISSTVEGACETTPRILGDAFDPIGFLHLLNREVLDVGGGRYGMSCFVAVFDPRAGTVVYANAGHPFPYVCRAADAAQAESVSARRPGHTELRALVSRGTPLGVAEPTLSVATLELATDDVVVFYTSALVDARNGEGVAYGERRLQRVLRQYVRPSGERACQVILDDAQVHHGGDIGEDVTLVAVRLGAGRARGTMAA
jgi:sigma-B regulation protein RsbU (phosphoserine phosphatase)